MLNTSIIPFSSVVPDKVSKGVLNRWRAALPVLASFSLNCAFCAPEWQPVKGVLPSHWAKDLSPEQVLPEYPRPQMALVAPEKTGHPHAGGEIQSGLTKWP